MLDKLGRLVRRCKIDFPSPEQTKRFQKPLSELVSILFAVVFGVGLSQLAEFDGTLDLAWLIVAYVAVLLSWWGYHYGTIIGPREDNKVLYAIDVLVIVVYWLIINYRAPVLRAFVFYAFMFLLYFVWELCASPHCLDRKRAELSQRIRVCFPPFRGFLPAPLGGEGGGAPPSIQLRP